MLRKLLIPLVILLMVSLACLKGGEEVPTETSSPPTKKPAAATPTKKAPTKAPTKLPTRTPVPTEPALEPTMAQEPTKQVDTSAPAYYTEEFDVAGAPNWHYELISGDADNLQLFTKDGKLIGDLNEQYMEVYFLYDPWTYKDIRVDTQVTNRGTNNYYYGVMTRYSEDEGYYLFLINPGGLYGIWRYDVANGNYKQIRTGGHAVIRQGKKSNTISAITKGEKLTLYINDTKVWSVDDENLREGQIGLVVIAMESIPVKLEFDWVTISEP